MKNSTVQTALLALSMLMFWSAPMWAQATATDGASWRVHDWNRPRPAIVTPAGPDDEVGPAPSDAIVLFDGTDLSNWRAMDGGTSRWIVKDGYMESVRGAGYVRTLQGFGDCQLHVEFMTPTPPEGDSQGRGNSGVFLMGRYEVQVLDSYDNVTYADGQCSAIYGQYPPQVNVCRKPGEWQSYDIIFKAPRFNAAGELLKPAIITVMQNGVLTQDHVEIKGPTNWCSKSPYEPHPGKLPLAFQDHGNPVRYRNVWVRELPATGRPDAYRAELILGQGQLQKYVGVYESRGGRVRITLSDGQLYSNHPGGSSGQPLYAESETRFYSKFVDAEYEFVLDGDAVRAIKVDVTHGGWSEYKKVE
ncbi:DUF1080 domain-containing protein [candidate division KSB1 bacterium]|nr:DUF1080 domain-containing protein [candidate division KSB1 bacterium]RQW07317.1 MAG: DUF1080 domain-containing protein [candidate division KSB1 bacterium]